MGGGTPPSRIPGGGLQNQKSGVDTEGGDRTGELTERGGGTTLARKNQSIVFYIY